MAPNEKVVNSCVNLVQIQQLQAKIQSYQEELPPSQTSNDRQIFERPLLQGKVDLEDGELSVIDKADSHEFDLDESF